VVMMVAEVMVTVGMAAARAAVVAALYEVLSADAPVGTPPGGNAKEVTRRRRRVTTAASSDDVTIVSWLYGSLPAVAVARQGRQGRPKQSSGAHVRRGPHKNSRSNGSSAALLQRPL
jgi:hypothetical protein